MTPPTIAREVERLQLWCRCQIAVRLCADIGAADPRLTLRAAVARLRCDRICRERPREIWLEPPPRFVRPSGDDRTYRRVQVR